MKKYNVDSFRASGKTYNAIAMALTFAACGKVVDFVVDDVRKIKFIKDVLVKRYDISSEPFRINYIRGYTHDEDTDVVICDECTYNAHGYDVHKLIVIEYNTPRDFVVLTNSIPNFMSIYTKFLMGELKLTPPTIATPNTSKEETDREKFIAALISIQESLHCTTDQALAVYNYAKERGMR